MTFAPATLKALGAFWVAQGGINSGIVGDTQHIATGTSYHLGKSQLSAGAYSIRTARDKAGLTEAASAIDLGKLHKPYGPLREFSVWLVGQCRVNAPGTRDIREVIYTADGVTVLGWSRENGYASKPIAGYGDSTHLWHTHVSYYRDSEFRDKTAVFKTYPPFRPPIAPPTDVQGGIVPTPSSYIPGYTATIKATANIRSAPSLTAPIFRVVPTSEKWLVTCWEKGQVDPADGSDQWLAQWANGHWEYTAHSNVSVGPTAPVGTPVPPPVDTTPYSQAQLDAATAAGVASGKSIGKTDEAARVRGVLGI